MAKDNDKILQEIKQTEISEFFAKNKNMLGFSSTDFSKNLLICVHEYVTNSIDNAIEAEMLPNIEVIIEYDPQYKDSESEKSNHLILSVNDEGTGIPEKVIPTIFSKLFQGSKFGVNVQKMGQQGIGSSGVTILSNMTTGKPVYMKTGNGKQTIEAEIAIDIKNNKSLNEVIKKYPSTFRGTQLKAYMGDVAYSKGQKSIEEYLKLIWMANPFSTITLKTPDGEKFEYKRITEKMPQTPVVSKYHPLGLAAYDLINLFTASGSHSLGDFIAHSLQRSSPEKIKELNGILKIDLFSIKKDYFQKSQADGIKLSENVIKAMKKLKWKKPSDESLIPIGSEILEKSVTELFKPEFKIVITRDVKAMSGGIPFIVEIALAYGDQCGKKIDGGNIEPLLIRFANRVPLLYDVSKDVLYNALKEIDISKYIKVEPSKIPLSIIVNVNSTHIPFNNVSKMAIDSDDDIEQEFKNAIMDGLRKISTYINKKYRLQVLNEHKNTMGKYIEATSKALSEISDGYRTPVKIKEDLEGILNKIIKSDENAIKK